MTDNSTRRQAAAFLAGRPTPAAPPEPETDSEIQGATIRKVAGVRSPEEALAELERTVECRRRAKLETGDRSAGEGVARPKNDSERQAAAIRRGL